MTATPNQTEQRDLSRASLGKKSAAHGEKKGKTNRIVVRTREPRDALSQKKEARTRDLGKRAHQRDRNFKTGWNEVKEQSRRNSTLKEGLLEKSLEDDFVISPKKRKEGKEKLGRAHAYGKRAAVPKADSKKRNGRYDALLKRGKKEENRNQKERSRKHSA